MHLDGLDEIPSPNPTLALTPASARRPRRVVRGLATRFSIYLCIYLSATTNHLPFWAQLFTFQRRSARKRRSVPGERMSALGSAHDSAHGGSRDRETAKDILHEVLHPHTKPSAVAVQYPNNVTCVDDDAAMRIEAEARGHPEISGCIDVGGMCIDVDGIGAVARKLCCSTCTAPGAPTQNLPTPSAGPVDIYFLAGQSGCVGLSSVAKLKASGRDDSLEREQPKVWFAGYHGVQSPEMFSISPMSPIANNLNTFGPELSLGERLHTLTGR